MAASPAHTHSAALLAQGAFVALALVLVVAFVLAAKDGEQRRSPDTVVRLLGPSYTGDNRLAPDFDLLDRDGHHHRLRDYHGKVLVLHFWSRTCEPCIDELSRSIPAFDEIVRNRQDMALLLVSVDAGWNAVAPLVPNGLRTPIVFDPDRAVSAGEYGTRLYPETWVIDPDGVIRARFDHTLDWSEPLWVDYLASLR